MLTTRWFYADEMPMLVAEVNTFLATLPKQLVKDVQYVVTARAGLNTVFGAWILYEVQV